MLTRLVLLGIVLFTCAADLGAAVTYRVTTEGHVSGRRLGAFGKQLGTFEVTADDGRIRALSLSMPEGEPVVQDGLLWLEGSPVVALNSTNSTWFHLDVPAPFAVSSLYLDPLPKPVIRNVKMQFADAGVIDGERRYTARLSYEVRSNFHGAPVKVFCTGTFEVTASTTVDRRFWMGRIFPMTRLPEIDSELSKVDAVITGLPLRIALTATRRYEGGAEMADSMTIETRDVATVPTPDPALFAMPQGYREQKPVIATPGASPR